MKTVAQNRRARFDYEILDTVEAGIILTGQEVKSCRQGNVNLSGSYVSMHTGKPVLINAGIAPYAFAGNLPDYNPNRDRELLLTRQEQEKLMREFSIKGVSLVPLEVRAGRHIKVLLGLARGRKRLDKRQRIKDREVQRKMKRGEEY